MSGPFVGLAVCVFVVTVTQRHFGMVHMWTCPIQKSVYMPWESGECSREGLCRGKYSFLSSFLSSSRPRGGQRRGPTKRISILEIAVLGR